MKFRRLMAALVPIVFLAGCASAVLVGGGKGGEAVHQQPSSADANIAREVNRRFVADPQVPAMDVEVDARNGIVTLTGKVPTRAAAERAAQLARTVPGVRGVRNLLRVGP